MTGPCKKQNSVSVEKVFNMYQKIREKLKKEVPTPAGEQNNPNDYIGTPHTPRKILEVAIRMQRE